MPATTAPSLLTSSGGDQHREVRRRAARPARCSYRCTRCLVHRCRPASSGRSRFRCPSGRSRRPPSRPRWWRAPPSARPARASVPRPVIPDACVHRNGSCPADRVAVADDHRRVGVDRGRLAVRPDHRPDRRASSAPSGTFQRAAIVSDGPSSTRATTMLPSAVRRWAYDFPSGRARRWCRPRRRSNGASAPA